MDKKDKKAYVKKPFSCPHCKSSDIQAEGDLEMGETQAWVEIICNTCKKTWRDIYTLTDVEDLEV
jgi:phage FluMu protein Com